MINYIPRRFTIIRDRALCTNCGLCVSQCSNECHFFDEENKTVLSNSNDCVACHRCVDLCPTGALRIEKYVCDYRENINWTPQYQQEICRQAESGSVLLSAMGNPKPYPIYWDKILLNASQVTNPSIDPLREPMEIRTILGRKPEMIKVEKKGKSTVEMPPQVMLETPIIFSAMSFGSISMNAQKSLAMAAKELGTLFNTGEGGLHPELADYCDCAVVQVASGRFGVHKDYLNNSKFIEIKIGQGAKPGIGGHLPGEKVNVEVSNARMIPEGSDAISPAPHHDIYS
ncbi:MAG: 4Fe-4S binding protein, partial [Eubacterium sp.]|nr:4Fe-4S binding protein [Eubacterium sp.]